MKILIIVHDNLQHSSLFQFFFLQFVICQSNCAFDELTQNIRFDPILPEHHSSKSGTTDTIDLVFHLVHQGENIGQGTNITKAQIESALLSLNRDFGAWPIHDNISIRPNGVDCEIFFRLACIDPQGNPTNGINRIDGTVIPNYQQEGIHFLPNGQGNNFEITALSDWDINRYINIWVTHRIETPGGTLTQGGGLGANVMTLTQGFSGVYVTHRVVGCDPDGSLGYNIINPYGKILSHEMGHYLGLLHTFEGESCLENDCHTEGDLVCDTEPHDNSVPITQDESCNEFIECATREPIENLMNYAGPTCGNIFTQGQKDRMKFMIDINFQGLLNQGYCENIVSSIEHIDKPTINIYPNPVSDILHIESSGNNEIIIFNTFGQIVKRFGIHKETSHLNVSELTPGIYFVSIRDSEYVNAVRMLIKR